MHVNAEHKMLVDEIDATIFKVDINVPLVPLHLDKPEADVSGLGL
jgi:hypothetical protein